MSLPVLSCPRANNRCIDMVAVWREQFIWRGPDREITRMPRTSDYTKFYCKDTHARIAFWVTIKFEGLREQYEFGEKAKNWACQ